MCAVKRNPLRAALLVAVILSCAAASGCSYYNEPETQVAYASSDGVSEEIGEIELLNWFVVTTAEGAPGNLGGGVNNEGDEDVTLTITTQPGEQGDGLNATLEVPAQTFVQIGGDDELFLLPSVGAPPGALLMMEVSSGATGGVQLRVPVLDDTLQQYVPLIPTIEPLIPTIEP